MIELFAIAAAFTVSAVVADDDSGSTVARWRSGSGATLASKMKAFCGKEAPLTDVQELAALAYGMAKPGWSGTAVRSFVCDNRIAFYLRKKLNKPTTYHLQNNVTKLLNSLLCTTIL